MTDTTATLATHEGGEAAPIQASDQLLRTVASCMLFENTYYESGDSIANRIAELVRENTPERVAEVAWLARTNLKLREVPLFVAVQMAISHRGSTLTRHTINAVVQRPDQIAETLALYWRAAGIDRKQQKGHSRIPAAVKKGLADAFLKFNEYSLAKWNRTDREVKLKDALFLVHAKPHNEAQGALFKRLIDGTLVTPDTWEVALSGGADKKETWTRLVSEKKLGAVATIMNIRNMVGANVETAVIRQAIENIGPRSRLLPFRFVAAAKAAPAFSEELGVAMLKSVEGYGRLAGKTALCIDISGSMQATLSERSQTARAEAAAALGILLREVCDEVRVYVFGTDVAEVGNLRGMGLFNSVSDMLKRNAVGSGTNIKGAVDTAERGNPDRIILVTDEQGHTVPSKGWKGYIINCAPYAPGIETGGNIQRINGLSDRILDWVSFNETGALLTATSGSEVDSES